MFKFFWKAPVQPRNQLVQDWRHDPLGHPALLAMNQRALADLPMVAEVPVRVGTVEVDARSGQGVSQELSCRCAGSR